MTTKQAFAVFDSALRARGLAVAVSEVGGAVVHKAGSDQGGAIRLVSGGTVGTLSLEITHSPPNESPVGWLDLYQAIVFEGELVPDQSDFSFEEALDHGLGLFVPNLPPAP